MKIKVWVGIMEKANVYFLSKFVLLQRRYVWKLNSFAQEVGIHSITHCAVYETCELLQANFIRLTNSIIFIKCHPEQGIIVFHKFINLLPQEVLRTLEQVNVLWTWTTSVKHS